MTASAELKSQASARVMSASSRKSSRHICAICADTMVAAEASALLANNVVSYLWTCETCGHGFVTKHDLPEVAAGSIAT